METTIDYRSAERRRTNGRAIRHSRAPRLTTVAVVRSYVNRVIAAMVLLVLAPLFLVIGFWIKRDSPGPILFRQRRFGLEGGIFDLFKFRSMYVDAEDRLQHILLSDPERSAEYKTFHKLRDDPRVTPVGRLLRRWSIDELPQLINVVRGEMNLVGPRAYLPVERELMGESAEVILSRKPGITGLWQVSGRNDLSFSERVQLERQYVEDRSAYGDTKIILRTFGVVLSGDGAN